MGLLDGWHLLHEAAASRRRHRPEWPCRARRRSSATGACSSASSHVPTCHGHDRGDERPSPARTPAGVVALARPRTGRPARYVLALSRAVSRRQSTSRIRETPVPSCGPRKRGRDRGVACRAHRRIRGDGKRCAPHGQHVSPSGHPRARGRRRSRLAGGRGHAPSGTIRVAPHLMTSICVGRWRFCSAVEGTGPPVGAERVDERIVIPMTARSNP